MIILIATLLSGSITYLVLKERPQRSVALSDKDESRFREEQPPRKVYPFSVIPGGVENGEELATKLRTDPVAGDHYSDFSLGRTVLVYANLSRTDAYVSYRKDGKIFWTKRRVSIDLGETLLTDGKNFARTRCGNRLSDLPQKPTSESEPSEEALLFVPTFTSNRIIRLHADLEAAPLLPLTSPHTLPSVGSLRPFEKLIAPTSFVPFAGGIASTSPTQIGNSPEPGTLHLLISGLVGVALFIGRARRSGNPAKS